MGARANFKPADQIKSIWHPVVQDECSKIIAECSPKPYDVTGGIIAFESGELDDAGAIELFQYLVNTGVAWQLQGSYGRTAANLIEQGLITPPGK